MKYLSRLFADLPLLISLALTTSLSLLHRAQGSDGPQPPVIYMVGDSTMADKPLFPPQPERGWGQMLSAYLVPEVRVVNFAANGRSSKSFREEGLWKRVMDRLHAGDYVIIQFGHNDEKKRGDVPVTRPFGSFKDNLVRYVREVREKQGNPILATPVARRVFDEKEKIADTHGEYAVAIRQVGAEQRVPLIEMERRSSELLARLGPELSKHLFMWCALGEWDTVPGGREDNTHFNAYGASRMCDIAVDELRTSVPELVRWLRVNE
jgi:lysophospholipase L1-like esterase